MRIDVLTLFPDMFETVLGTSIIGRAREKHLIELNFHNIRDFSNDKNKRVDDYPYGGGLGMVMQCEPIYNAYSFIQQQLNSKPYVIQMSPQGDVFNQQKAIEMRDFENIVIICGHYEGIDDRINTLIVDEEISIGDFVLTGGEIPAMAIIDTIVRLLPGVLKHEDCYINESFSDGLLEYPQYTRPYSFMGLCVPDVLLSGNHKKIEEWRRYESLKRTCSKKPWLIKKALLSDEDKKNLETIVNDNKK